jgi:hypothetical protein
MIFADNSQRPGRWRSALRNAQFSPKLALYAAYKIRIKMLIYLTLS